MKTKTNKRKRPFWMQGKFSFNPIRWPKMIFASLGWCLLVVVEVANRIAHAADQGPPTRKFVTASYSYMHSSLVQPEFIRVNSPENWNIKCNGVLFYFCFCFFVSLDFSGVIGFIFSINISVCTSVSERSVYQKQPDTMYMPLCIELCIKWEHKLLFGKIVITYSSFFIRLLFYSNGTIIFFSGDLQIDLQCTNRVYEEVFVVVVISFHLKKKRCFICYISNTWFA